MPKIELKRLQRIIREEMQSLKEGADHDAASKLMSSATKLLNAIESFNESSSENAKVSVGDSLSLLEKKLKMIIASPLQYVDATSAGPEKKIVSLKPVKQ